jgi:thioredoxin-like negative regulator of GroEL
MADIQPITSIEKYRELVEQNDATFLIELYAPWCTKCKKLESALREAGPKCDMYKLNIDADPFIDDPAFESVSSLPCIWLYKSGKKHDIPNANVDVVMAIVEGRRV